MKTSFPLWTWLIPVLALLTLPLRGEKKSLVHVITPEEALGAKTVQVIRSAETVYAQRMHVVWKEVEGGGQSYTIETDPEKIPVSDAERAALASFLTTKQYLTNGVKMCGFFPAIKYVFVRGKDQASVTACFQCRDMASRLNADEGLMCAFDPGYDRLLEITSKVFPKDPDFLRLKKESEIPVPSP